MEREWYYQSENGAVGPLSVDELRKHVADGKIDTNTLIRNGDKGKWVSAEKVRGLLDATLQAHGTNYRWLKVSEQIKACQWLMWLHLILAGLCAVGWLVAVSSEKKELNGFSSLFFAGAFTLGVTARAWGAVAAHFALQADIRSLLNIIAANTAKHGTSRG